MASNALSLWVMTALLVIALFVLVYAVRRYRILAQWMNTPAVYLLALGTSIANWALFGSTQFAYGYGYSYLCYYFGFSAVFFLAPILLVPLQRVKQGFQLETLTDLMVYRYRSQTTGALMTLMMCVLLMPLMALQLQVLDHLLTTLNPQADNALPLFIIMLLTGCFIAYAGIRSPDNRYGQPSLIGGLAFLSLVKYALLAFVVIGCFLTTFGNFEGLQGFLANNPQALNRLYHQDSDKPWRSLMLTFCTALLALPHLYHVVLSNKQENIRNLHIAAWAFPSTLLLAALAVPLTIWMADSQGIEGNPSYFLLGLAQKTLGQSGGILAIWLMAMSAALPVLALSALALSIMMSHYWALPLYQPSAARPIYGWLSWIRRFFIFAVLFMAWGFYSIAGNQLNLADLGLVSFIGTLQLLPGLIGVLFWPRANKIGLLVGLLAGTTIWIVSLLLPLAMQGELGAPSSLFSGVATAMDNWPAYALLALSVNLLLFIILSFITGQNPAEIATAQICTVQNVRRPYRWAMAWHSVEDVVNRLTPALGIQTARREVVLALRQLRLSKTDQRPYMLRRLRDQIEINLCALLGPRLAQSIIDKHLPYLSATDEEKEDIYYIDQLIGRFEYRLTGLTGILDQLRRFHRQTILALPIGVISLSEDGEIIGWNLAMAKLSRIRPEEVIGSQVNTLGPPWQTLILPLIATNAPSPQQATVTLFGKAHCLRLKATDIQTAPRGKALRGKVVVIEDVTDIKQLENQLAHNERLASIGKLAAGVAHEIGNPLTAISCLTQELKEQQHEPMTQEITREILSQTSRISDIVQSLVSFSHHGGQPRLKLQPVNAHAAVEAAIQLAKLNPKAKTLRFYNHVPPALWVLGNEQKLQQVFINLLSNARDACSAGCQISITSSHSKSESFALISIADEGAGIEAAIQNKLFDPFFTTKPPGQGTGLGLSLVLSIIQEFNGRVKIQSPITPQEKGTEVQLWLQVAQQGIIAPQSELTNPQSELTSTEALLDALA